MALCLIHRKSLKSNSPRFGRPKSKIPSSIDQPNLARPSASNHGRWLQRSAVYSAGRKATLIPTDSHNGIVNFENMRREIGAADFILLAEKLEMDFQDQGASVLFTMQQRRGGRNLCTR